MIVQVWKSLSENTVSAFVHGDKANEAFLEDDAQLQYQIQS